MSRLLFSKTGRAKYISHLDLMRTFQRAFQRADLKIKHTEGFNPHPFISILLPLSLGYSSQCEILDFQLMEDIPCQEVPERLNAVLPEGIFVERCYENGKKAKELVWVEYSLTMEYDDNRDLSDIAAALTELFGRERIDVVKKSNKAKGGETIVDIAPLVKSYSVTASKVIALDVVIRAQNPGLNPKLLVTAFEANYPAYLPDFVSIHRKAVMSEALNLFE